MRGIYYAYAIRLVTLPGVLQGFLMLGAMIALTNFVSLGNVINNITQIQVSHLGIFTYNAVRTTEVWTLLLIGLFIFAMLVLVLAANLPLVFIGWEGVGLTSYLLIGFWFADPQKAACGKKAFVVNRIGDFGFLLAMFLIVGTFGSLNPPWPPPLTV